MDDSRRSRSGSIDSLGRHKRKREPKRSSGGRGRSRSRSPSRSPSRSRSRSRSPLRRGGRHGGGSSSSSRYGGRDRRRRSRDRQSRSRSRERGGSGGGGSSARDRERMRGRRSPSRSLSRSRRENGDQRSSAIAASTNDRKDGKTSNATGKKDMDTDSTAGATAVPSALSHLTEEEQMQALMGFGGFESTKGKPVEDNVQGAATGGIRKENKREYRQYMNRRGGFNRPLENAK